MARSVLPNLTPVTMYCVIIANVRSTLLVWGNPKFDNKFIIHTWIMFHHPSRATYNSGLGVLCDLIYDKAFFFTKIVHLLETDKLTFELLFCIWKWIWRSFQIWCHASINCICCLLLNVRYTILILWGLSTVLEKRRAWLQRWRTYY